MRVQITDLVGDQQTQRSIVETFRQVPERPDAVLVVIRKNGISSSGHTFLRLDFAAASIIFLPVKVDPVNAILSTSGWAESAAPPIEPREGTVLITPGGNLRVRQYY